MNVSADTLSKIVLNKLKREDVSEEWLKIVPMVISMGLMSSRPRSVVLH
jgi:hypothetical protein